MGENWEDTTTTKIMNSYIISIHVDYEWQDLQQVLEKMRE